MGRRSRGIAGVLAPAALAASLLVAGCGDDDDEPSSTEAPGEAPGGADELIACLEEAGYDAIEGGEILGLEGDYTPVQFPLGDLEQGAAFIVHPGEATAEGAEDTASALIGVAPSERGCLPS